MDRNNKTNKFKNIFIEPTEKFIASLGHNYIKSYLTDGSVTNGFAVVSNKRVYFKGSCFERDGKKFFKTREERIVDLNDITGTGYINTRLTWMLVTAITIAAYFIITLMVVLSSIESNTDMPKVLNDFLLMSVLASPLASIVFAIAYVTRRRNLFEISFAGGKICFDAIWYDKVEIDKFQRKVRLAKDNIIQEKYSSIGIKDKKESMPKEHISSVLDELKKSSDLLKEGVITKEEHEKIKSNLLNQ